MENNAVVRIRFNDLLGILEAREVITVYNFVGEKPIKSNASIYELLADKEFMKQYGNYFVRGLISFPVTTNILIAKEEI